MNAPAPRARRAPTGLPVAPELALRERAEHDDALGVAGADRGVGDRDRRASAVAAAPEGLRGEVEVAHAERRAQAHRLVALHVGDEAVDVAHREAGVFDGVADGDARQLELGLRRLAALVVARLADTDDGGSAVHYRPCTTGGTRGRRCSPRILARDSSARFAI